MKRLALIVALVALAATPAEAQKFPAFVTGQPTQNTLVGTEAVPVIVGSGAGAQTFQATSGAFAQLVYGNPWTWPQPETFDSLILGNVTGGGTQCLHASNTGAVTGTGSDCGSGGGGAVSSVFGRTGTVTAQSGDYSFSLIAGALPLTQVAAQAADTVVMNASGGAASPAAVALISCSTASSALTYNTTTHVWGCNTISGSGTVNSGTAGQLAGYAATGTAVSPFTTGNGISVSATNGTINLTVPDSVQTTAYTVAAADMAGTINLGGAGSTLTIPAISSTVLAANMSVCYANRGSGNWTISSTPTINGLPSTTVFPGGGGCFVSNGTTLDWQPGRVGDEARLNLTDQVLNGGANVTVPSLTTGALTVDCGKSPLQEITNGGAFTITAPANDGSCVIKVINNASAGAITFSGFEVGANTGDALNTTSGSKFFIYVARIGGDASYRVAALQ